jgi:drug/metabolite transporter (DMT)-like permease
MFDDNEQKSPKRRFLLILGLTAFTALIVFGLMVIFWDRMLPNLPKTQKALYGAIIIIYAVIRFARVFRKERDEE